MDLDNRKMIKKDRGGFALVFPNYCALTVDGIREIFSQFGRVRSVNLTGDQCGYRFVRYENYEDAKSAIEGLRDHPDVKLCTHGPRKKVDANNNNNSSKGNLNETRNDEVAPSVVVSDDSEDWENSGSKQSAGSTGYAESSVSLGCESRSRKDSGSSSSRPGSLRETMSKAAAAPRRNADERSGTRSEYRGNVLDKDRMPAGRTGQLDVDWRGTRDNSHSGNFDANKAWNSSRSANNQSAAWSGNAVKSEDCHSVWDFDRSSVSQSTMRPRTVKTEDCGGVWDSAVRWNNHSTERSKAGRNEDCGGVWDLAVPWDNHSNERSKAGRNENCGGVWDSAVPWNNHSTERWKTGRNKDCGGVWDSAVPWDNHSNERSKTVRNEDCGGVWDSAVPWNNHSNERSKTVRNEDCGRNSRNTMHSKTIKNEDRNSLWVSNRKLNGQNETNCKTNRRNFKGESVSKSTDSIWDSITNDQSEKPNQNVQQKSASKEIVGTRTSDNDKTNKSTEQQLSPNREINLHSRLVKIQTINNQCNAITAKNNADVDTGEECIPHLVERKNHVSQNREEVVIQNASEVIVGNIPENVTPAYVLYLLEEYEPIAISAFHSGPNTSLRYCHVYFKKDKDALDVELQYDHYKLAGRRLIVSRPNRLTVLAAKD